MINMIQNAKDQAAALAMAAYQAAVADGTLPQADVKTAPVEIPKDTANGDFTTTFALAASKALRQPPRNIAQALLDHMKLEGTTTRFQIQGPRVILTRSGTVNSQMVFEEGRQHTSLYETPFGELSVDIQTSVLKHNLTERGGLMEIKYSIAVEHTVTGRNCFKIRVRRKH